MGEDGPRWKDVLSQSDWGLCAHEDEGDCRYTCTHSLGSTVELHALLFLWNIITEGYLNQPVKNAVITVPAYFNDSQRQVSGMPPMTVVVGHIWC